jgi:dTDP-glucose pyrophosphorylase/predicted transcriptional regulator
MKYTGDSHPVLANLTVRQDATLLEALRILELGSESIAFVCDESGRIIGTLTDGDLRRALLSGESLDSRCLERAMMREFAFVQPSTSRAEVLDIMRARGIGQLPIIDNDRRLKGLHTIGEMLSTGERENWAVILAGGRGTRLYPLTETVPKPMIPVAGRPILERLVLHLMSHGIRRIFLSVNYLSHIIERHFGDGSGFGCGIEYLREQEPLGTGGPLSLLPSTPTAPVLVVNGDLVTQCDIGKLIDFHEEGKYFATFGVRPYIMDIPFGVARVEGEQLIELREKPTERMLINAGIYVLSPEATQMVPKNVFYPITEIFSSCLAKNLPVGAPLIEDEWLDIGRPEQLLHARGEA